MNINDQKKVANKVLLLLKTIDPYCILAGGAPRDWYLGRTASDLDFYFTGRYKNIADVIVELDKLGLPTSCNTGDFQLYDRNPHVLGVFSGDLDGITVQLILVNQSPTYAVSEFALDLSQAWYVDGKIWTTPDFDIAVSKKIIRITNHLYGNGDAYVLKIIEKFPEYTFVGYAPTGVL